VKYLLAREVCACSGNLSPSVTHEPSTPRAGLARGRTHAAAGGDRRASGQRGLDRSAVCGRLLRIAGYMARLGDGEVPDAGRARGSSSATRLAGWIRSA
jgi:hypothetical protein